MFSVTGILSWGYVIIIHVTLVSEETNVYT